MSDYLPGTPHLADPYYISPEEEERLERNERLGRLDRLAEWYEQPSAYSMEFDEGRKRIAGDLRWAIAAIEKDAA
jgi:hypothetical protein